MPRDCGFAPAPCRRTRVLCGRLRRWLRSAAGGQSRDGGQAREGIGGERPLSPQQQEAVDDAYVACLNAHGAQARVMPGGGVGLIATPASQGRVATARKACQKLLPKGGLPPPSASQIDQRVAQMLKLAGCMRSNGVPKFRDATATGSLMINPSSGIDPQSPQFQQAQRACAKDFPGSSPP